MKLQGGADVFALGAGLGAVVNDLATAMRRAVVIEVNEKRRLAGFGFAGHPEASRLMRHGRNPGDAQGGNHASRVNVGVNMVVIVADGGGVLRE